MAEPTNLSLPRLSVAARVLLAMSEDREAQTTAVELTGALGISLNHAQVTLSELIKRGAVARVKRGGYVRLVAPVEVPRG